MSMDCAWPLPEATSTVMHTICKQSARKSVCSWDSLHKPHLLRLTSINTQNNNQLTLQFPNDLTRPLDVNMEIDLQGDQSNYLSDLDEEIRDRVSDEEVTDSDDGCNMESEIVFDTDIAFDLCI